MKTFSLFASLLLLSVVALFAEPAATVTKPQNVTIDEAQKLIKNDPKIVVLDVRTPEEFKTGHIAGAKNIDFNADDFEKQIATLDKSKTYVVHCAAGGRSAKACEQIKTMDFKSMLHMNQGFNAWKEAGKPIEKE